MDILWDRDAPITGLLAFLDRERRSFCFYITGYDDRYAALSPGTMIVAHAIREAIRNGFRVFELTSLLPKTGFAVHVAKMAD